MSWFRKFAATAVVAVVGLIAGCGSDSSSSNTNVRLLNLDSEVPSMDMVVGGNSVNSAIAFRAVGNYGVIEAGGKTIQTQRTGSTTPLFSIAPNLAGDQHYSIITYLSGGVATPAVLQEDQSTPGTGQSALQIMNLAPDAGSLDVYLTGANDSLNGLAATFSSVGGTQRSGFKNLSPNKYRVRVVGYNKKGEDVRLDIPEITLADNAVATLILTTQGGLLVDGLLMPQQGTTVSAFASNVARVRVIAGVSGNGTGVVTTLDGKPVGGVVDAAGAPSGSSVGLSISGYSLVTPGAGVVISNVTPSGGATLPATCQAPCGTAIKSGGDYTILVWGTPAAPSYRVITDDNRLPSDGVSAKLRLLNGLDNPSTALSLALDSRVYANNIVPGTVSSYSTVAASTGSTVDLVTSGLQTVFSKTDQKIVAKGIYTMYVLGSDPKAALFVQDR